MAQGTTSLFSILSVMAAICAASPGASAGDRLSLTITPAAEKGTLTVVDGGATARVAEDQVTLTLDIDGRISDDATGFRLIGSELYLKQAGSAAGVTTAFDGGTAGRSITRSDTFNFRIDQLGPVAQNAIALCASAGVRHLPDGAEARLAMTVPVVWRVTTGRFNFRSFAFDGVKPSEDALANPDFYTDQASEEIEAAVLVDVRCEGNVIAAVQPATSKTSTAAGTQAKPVPAKAAVAANPKTGTSKPTPNARPANSAPAPSSGAILVDNDAVAPAADLSAGPAASQRPVCEGGMVRETLGTNGTTDYHCLCPGHTRRTETGPGAFSCERRIARGK